MLNLNTYFIPLWEADDLRAQLNVYAMKQDDSHISYEREGAGAYIHTSTLSQVSFLKTRAITVNEEECKTDNFFSKLPCCLDLSGFLQNEASLEELIPANIQLRIY